jgi:tRNA threonylcarbamoyladenosine biosynthesis protein TsaB
MSVIKNHLLAIDTATGPCSVAVWDGGEIVAYVENTKPVMQSASLMPMVEEVLQDAGIGYAALGLVTCTVGPGSFTGIRVGLASAKAIAFAAGIPGVGYTTLEVLAFAARGADKDIVAILNAGKGEWYYQRFSGSMQALGAPVVDALPEVAGAMIAGNAPLEPSCGITFPRADALAELAAMHSGMARALTPFYIRAPDAKLPAKKL